MSRRLAVLLVAAVLAALAGHLVGPSLDGGGSASRSRVTRVVDGDTVVVRLGGRSTHVRIIGVDTPEIAHPGRPGACFGRQAARRTRAVVGGQEVRLTPGVERHDRYGRTLAAVRILTGPAAGRDLAELLAGEGYARPLPIPPNTADAPVIAALVTTAERRGAGLWTACGFARAFPGRRP